MKEINLKAKVLTREDFDGDLMKFAKACVNTDDIVNEAIIDLFSSKVVDAPSEILFFEIMQKISDDGKLTTPIIINLMADGIGCLKNAVLSVITKKTEATKREKLAICSITTYLLKKSMEENEPSKEHK